MSRYRVRQAKLSRLEFGLDRAMHLPNEAIMHFYRHYQLYVYLFGICCLSLGAWGSSDFSAPTDYTVTYITLRSNLLLRCMNINYRPNNDIGNCSYVYHF